MLKSFKFIAREYKTKNNTTFMKLTCKGEFLPLVTAEVDKYYTIKFASKSLAKEPAKEGIYSVAYEEGGLWLDTRIENFDKNIARVNAIKIQFEKPLTKNEK